MAGQGALIQIILLINLIAYFDALKTSGMEPFAFVHGVHNSRIFYLKKADY